MGRKPVTVSLSAQTVLAGRPLSIEISSQACTASEWTVHRRRQANKLAETVKLTWSTPVSGLQVWQYLMDRRTANDPEWRPYGLLEAHPTDEGGHA